MLKTNSKVYIVSEYGGEYEDKWEHAIGVCSSLELAEELKAKVLANRKPNCVISEDEYHEMLDRLYEYEDEHGEICDTEVDGLIQLFPQYSREDLEIADQIYSSYDDFVGIGIEEINFYSDTDSRTSSQGQSDSN